MVGTHLAAGRWVSASDKDLLATAIRETREELGIALEGARLLGNLEALHPGAPDPAGSRSHRLSSRSRARSSRSAGPRRWRRSGYRSISRLAARSTVPMSIRIAR